MTETSYSLVKVLSAWADKNCGMFYETHLWMNAYKSFGSQQTVSDETRNVACRDFIILTSFIASAKNCLTDEIKQFMVQAHAPWVENLHTKDAIAEMIEKGANMSEKEFDRYMKEERDLLGEQIDKSLLYCSLCLSGIDGLNTQEIIRFLRVGRHMGVSETELNQLLMLYFQERALIAGFKKNITGQSHSQSKL